MFSNLQIELSNKGTESAFIIKHEGSVISFLYENVKDSKEQMDSLVKSHLVNYNITTTLSGEIYKGDAVLIQY